MEFVALVTLLLIVEYIFFTAMVGKARVQGSVEAPAMTGDETFERASRVQVNTLEQLIITIPAMWICATYFRVDVAAVMGLVFLIARLIYRSAYMTEPAKRGPATGIGFLANAILVLTGAWGVVGQLLS